MLKHAKEVKEKEQQIEKLENKISAVKNENIGDDIFILKDNNISKCPFGLFCMGKGNLSKNHKSHTSLKGCPMYKMFSSQLAQKFVFDKLFLIQTELLFICGFKYVLI